MGVCDTKNNIQKATTENKSNEKPIQNIEDKKKILSKEGYQENQISPLTVNETLQLFSFIPAICKIKYKSFDNGILVNCCGTGFFCLLNFKDIPFKKALFTNNHILSEDEIQVNKIIEFEYCDKPNKITITKERKVFTDEDLDYTCIQIFDNEQINKFFSIDEAIMNNKQLLINDEIIILQYPKGKLAHDKGRILEIEKDEIKHNVPTYKGSSGSPLIKRYNMNLIIGIHMEVILWRITYQKQKK